MARSTFWPAQPLDWISKRLKPQRHNQGVVFSRPKGFFLGPFMMLASARSGGFVKRRSSGATVGMETLIVLQNRPSTSTCKQRVVTVECRLWDAECSACDHPQQSGKQSGRFCVQYHCRSLALPQRTRFRLLSSTNTLSGSSRDGQRPRCPLCTSILQQRSEIARHAPHVQRPCAAFSCGLFQTPMETTTTSFDLARPLSCGIACSTEMFRQTGSSPTFLRGRSTPVAVALDA